MPIYNQNPTQTIAWKKLNVHFSAIKDTTISTWFKQNPNRVQNLQIQWENFLVDFSKNRITTETLRLLIDLAQEMKLKQAIDLQFSGVILNQTENRAVLHTALRAKNKKEEVKHTLQRMKSISEELISGEWKGCTGKRITDIVNIGIGGSDLGPKMIYKALEPFKTRLRLHFVSTLDTDYNSTLIEKLNPETTVFIVVSKSFSTLETLTNATFFKEWFTKNQAPKFIKKHFLAVSANVQAVKDFGISEENILPMWDWVGGRFSVWSAVGLSICCGIGFENFNLLLKGAQKMDHHFRTAPFSKNIPVTSALLSVWYNNFFKTETEAIIPYSAQLTPLVPYLQQAFMESNGKQISRAGTPVNYQTGNIVWGAVGTNAQHAFFQLLHQGTKLIPCEFIGFKKPIKNDREIHDKLMANFFAQTEALLRGKTKEEVESELADISKTERDFLIPFKCFEGNRPSTTLLIEQLNPENLGSLIALYEHKIFVEGVIWNIFSYDQWGVELGKGIAKDIEQSLCEYKIPTNSDPSTKSLIKNYLAQ